MQAIILVGGLGTRLRALIKDVPKPMAPIHNQPFLAYLLQYLKTQGITHVIFSVHHLREKISDFFQSQYLGMDITYVEEDEPLGTGGAILHSLNFVKPKQPIFILNGDTFVKLNYKMMYEQHQQSNAALTIALRLVDDCSRYGKAIIHENRIIAFKEKNEVGEGYINAGIYLIHPQLFLDYQFPKQFSIEKDFLYPEIPTLKPHAFISANYFIDIGVPEDYERAQRELPLEI